ncbi:hypothetical protein PCANC_06999 [Puccinia coronata f. sp. avenae]|uniref:Uncharacterized protein n=1 Tax=Puccinia coronata f. sp. avenae TaxID=200324 RepID=A0A2N5UZR0_9BASI|nr:hypothetical protein PCANC_06999 [Puccinia coronata f. sp. avenae]
MSFNCVGWASGCKWAWTAHGSPKTRQFLGQPLSQRLGAGKVDTQPPGDPWAIPKSPA